jgi:hypothetical protein
MKLSITFQVHSPVHICPERGQLLEWSVLKQQSFVYIEQLNRERSLNVRGSFEVFKKPLNR